MPFGNGRGPPGMGPGTGRGRGPCATEARGGYGAGRRQRGELEFLENQAAALKRQLEQIRRRIDQLRNQPNSAEYSI